MKKGKRETFAGVFVVAALCAGGSAFGEVEVDWGAFVENDLRASVDRVDEPGIERNLTTLGADLSAGLIPDKLRFVGELQFAWIGFTRDMEFEGLTSREKVSPYYLESNAAYLEVTSILPDLDLRVGRQVVHWGAADMFNPTNNLNALDLEDPLKFGESIANEMIRVDWAPGGGKLIFTGVWVPVFQPAMVPGSARLAIGDPSAEFPFVKPRTRLEAEKLRSLWLNNPDYYVVDQPVVHTEMPDFSLANSQFGIRAQWIIGLLDMSLSYFQGFDPMPLPKYSYSSRFDTGEMSPDGVPKIGVATDVRLSYPRKRVVGFDLAGQIPFLDDMGFWFEGAMNFPKSMEMVFDVTEVAPGSKLIKGDVVDDKPFLKYTAGADYTINQYLFVTGQFVHGFIDEFGADAIHDYWVAGLDCYLFQQRLLLRMFAVGEIPHEDKDIELDENGDGAPDSKAKGATRDGDIFSHVLFPSIVVKPLDGLELTLGSYILMGHKESKLAQDAAGPSLVFFRARASF